MNSNLKGYRNMLNLSQQDMADILKITREWYQKKETGQRDFNQTEIEVIMKLLKVDRPNLTVEEVFLRK